MINNNKLTIPNKNIFQGNIFYILTFFVNNLSKFNFLCYRLKCVLFIKQEILFGVGIQDLLRAFNISNKFDIMKNTVQVISSIRYIIILYNTIKKRVCNNTHFKKSHKK